MPVFMIGVPLGWAVLLLFHPTGDGDEVYPVVSEEVTAWLIVHIGTLVFVPLMAVVVYLLLRGVESTAARVSRIALVPFVAFYTAFETLIGIGTGLFAAQVNGLPSAEETIGARAVEDYIDSGIIKTFELVGTGAWLVALIAAGVALRQARAPLAVPILLALAAIPIAWHVPPFGQVGLGLFVVAALLALRGRRAPTSAAAPAAEPTPA